VEVVYAFELMDGDREISENVETELLVLLETLAGLG